MALLEPEGNLKWLELRAAVACPVARGSCGGRGRSGLSANSVVYAKILISKLVLALSAVHVIIFM